jgi:hypothetical protein
LDFKALKVILELKVTQELKGQLVIQELKDHKELKVIQVLKVTQVLKGLKVM